MAAAELEALEAVERSLLARRCQGEMDDVALLDCEKRSCGLPVRSFRASATAKRFAGSPCVVVTHRSAHEGGGAEVCFSPSTVSKRSHSSQSALAIRYRNRTSNGQKCAVDMMEPVTIVTTVLAVSKVVSQLAITLYTFVQSAREVDKSLGSLLAQVEGLKTAVTTIKKELGEPITKNFLKH